MSYLRRGKKEQEDSIREPDARNFFGIQQHHGRQVENTKARYGLKVNVYIVFFVKHTKSRIRRIDGINLLLEKTS